MPRFNVRDVIQAISIENTAVNEYLDGDDGAAFRQYPGDPIPAVLPTRTPVEDNAVGDGRAYPKQSKPYYFNVLNHPWGMALNSTMGHRVLRMFNGGTITDTPNVPLGITDQSIAMKNPGEAPMVCNLIRKLGGEAFLFGDCYVQTVEIQQQMAGEPRIQATFNNPGHHAALADTLIDLNDVEAMDTYLKYHGAKTSLTFTDGVDSFDFASEGRLIDVSCSLNQNCKTDQLPGDTFLDTANECYGAFAKNFFIDLQSAEMRCKVYMDSNFDEFTSWKANRKLTSVIMVFKSCEKIGVSTAVSEVEIKFPIAEFNLEGDQQDNFSAYSFSIRAIEGDPVTGSLALIRLRRVTGDLIDETLP